MKKLGIIILFFSLFTACSDDDGCEQAIGNRVLENRILETISIIDVGLSADVSVEVDTSINYTEVGVLAQSGILDNIATYAADSILKIEFNQCIDKHEEIKILIKTPRISALVLSGSGVIRTSEKIQQKQLTVTSLSSGDCNLLVDVKDLTVTSYGSGELHFAGFAQQATVNLNSSGDLFAFEMPSDTLSVISQSGGNAEVRVINILNATLNGNGDVYYKGAPIINRTGAGSGRVINLN